MMRFINVRVTVTARSSDVDRFSGRSNSGLGGWRVEQEA